MALTTPFAQNGDKKAIPQNTSDGSVSFDRGFGSFYALPPEEGGLFIDRAQFNQLMYDTTSQVLENKQALSNLSGSTYNKTEVNNLVNAKIDITKATKILTENLVKTVGASGADFANLRQALEWASQYSYSGGRFTITLNCNADMPIPGTNLPFGEAIIIIDGQNNTFNCNNNHFMAFAHALTQRITIKNFTFNCNNITSTSYGTLIQSSDQKVILENITINVNNSTISTLIVNQRGFLTTNGITLNCQGNTNITNVITGVYSTIICSDLVVNVSQLNGTISNLFNLNSGQSNLKQGSSVTQALPTNKISKQITINNGAIVACGNRFNDSKLSIAPNTLTSAGIIFKS